MGCGSSKGASASDAPVEPDAKKGRSSKLEDARGVGISGVDATAAVAVAAGAATLVAGATSDGARGALSNAASAAGGALLGFAKELPWVAPIAFLVAGVVEAAANVHALKRDAQTFAANVRSVENVMLEAGRKGHLGKVEETCMALQFEMEEGLAFCHKLKTQYFVTQMLTSGRDCQKFKDISDSMHRQVTIIAAAASIAAHDVVMEEYEQGVQLADKIAELGGAAAVAADPEKKAACQEFMKASDALIFEAVDEVQRAVRAEAAKSQKKIDMILEESRQQREEARLQTKVLEDQVSKLTSMMEVLLKTRMDMALGGEGVDLSQDDGKAKPEVEKAVDEQLKAENVRDLMSRMPIPEDEDERLRVVRKMGFEARDVSDLIGDPDFERLVDEACAEFGVEAGMISSIDGTRETALSMASYDDAGNARRADGFWMPKVATACQHVIKKRDVISTNGTMADMPEVPRLNMPEMMALAASGADPEMGRWFPVMGAVGADGGASPDDAIVPNQSLLEGTKPATYGAFRIFAEKASDMEAVTHYSGAPINVEGQCVGTFCVMDGKRRDDVDVEKLRAYAARAAKLIEEKAAKRGFGGGTAA